MKNSSHAVEDKIFYLHKHGLIRLKSMNLWRSWSCQPGLPKYHKNRVAFSLIGRKIYD